MTMVNQVLFQHRDLGETVDLKTYQGSGGYEGLKKALKKMAPAEVVETVKASNMRGRGGAGFPTGVKWSFFPCDLVGEKYLVCNGDEMEPGTYKDRELLMTDPHQLVEGMIIAAYAMQITEGYIFLRYAYEDCRQAVGKAMAEAKDAGLLGKDILGTGFTFNLHLHGSAGRYICGEETALLSGLEGNRPNPRSKPPFPAQSGLFGKPTTVNNIETFANVPHILAKGAEWFRSLALTEGEAGTKLFGLSGHMNKTPCLELPLGVPLRQVVEEFGGGVWKGRKFKACLPGGASTPFMTAEHLDTPMDFSSVEKVKTRFGTAGVTVFDDHTCMVAASLNLNRFFARESCGWCTPCRDGLPYINWLLERFESGEATYDDLDLLKHQFTQIDGKSFCALAQGAMGPVESLLRLFEQELIDHIEGRGCPFEK